MSTVSDKQSTIKLLGENSIVTSGESGERFTAVLNAIVYERSNNGKIDIKNANVSVGQDVAVKLTIDTDFIIDQ